MSYFPFLKANNHPSQSSRTPLICNLTFIKHLMSMTSSFLKFCIVLTFKTLLLSLPDYSFSRNFVDSHYTHCFKCFSGFHGLA